MTGTRNRLLEALRAIARAKPAITFATAFRFLARYVPGKDRELTRAFDKAEESMKGGRSNKPPDAG